MLENKTKKWMGITFLFLTLFACISMITIASNKMFIPNYLGNLPLKQLLWYLVGFFFLFLIQKMKGERLMKHAWYLYFLGILSLLLLFPFGTSINHSKCWFVIPKIGSIQPSEFMKVALLLVLVVHLKSFWEKEKNKTWKDEFIYLIQVFLIVLPPSILTFLEPDTGAVIIYGVITLVVLLFSKIRFRWILGIFIVLFLFIGAFSFLYFQERDIFIQLFGSNLFYRIDRLLDWKTGDGYQLQNALSAIGSAGLFGHGFKKNPIYFPESTTDFIFAVFASSFGYIASFLLILLLFSFDLYLFFLAKKKTTGAKSVFILAISVVLLYQQSQNIGMTLSLFPITGITLPFISYGGSSLLSYFIMIGIILSFLEEKEKRIV